MIKYSIAIILIVIAGLYFAFFYEVRKYNPSAGLISAVASQNVSFVKQALEKSKDLNVMENGVTPLHAAVLGNKHVTEIIQLLIKRGANIDSRDQLGRTPLILAIQNKQRIDIIRMLIVYGSNTKILDLNGKTALDYAYEQDYSEAIILLSK